MASKGGRHFLSLKHALLGFLPTRHLLSWEEKGSAAGQEVWCDMAVVGPDSSFFLVYGGGQD